jgi:hypothetical protein
MKQHHASLRAVDSDPFVAVEQRGPTGGQRATTGWRPLVNHTCEIIC